MRICGVVVGLGRYECDDVLVIVFVDGVNVLID